MPDFKKKPSFWLDLEQKISKHPIFILTIIGLLTAFFLYYSAAHMKVDSDVKNLLPGTNKVKIFSDNTSLKFGDSAGVLIAIENPKGIYNKETFDKIKEISDKMELLDNQIASDRVTALIPELSQEQLKSFIEMMNAKLSDFQNPKDLEVLLKDESALSEFFNDASTFSILRKLAENSSKTERIYEIFKNITVSKGEWNKRIRDVKSMMKINYVFSDFADTQGFEKFFASQKINPQQGIVLANFLLEKNRITESQIKDYLLNPSFSKISQKLGMEGQDYNKIVQFADLQFKKLAELIKKSPKRIKTNDLVNKEEYAKNPEKEIFLAQERIRSWDFFENAFYSKKNPNMTAIMAELPPLMKTEELQVLFPYLKRMVDETLKETGINYYIAGEPVVTDEISTNIIKNMSALIPLVLIVFAFVLYLTFKHWVGVLLPCLAVFFATIWSFGTIFLTGGAISTMLSVFPVILIAVASGFGVHMIHRYYYLRVTGHDQDDALKKTIEQIGFAVFMSAMTVIAGFLAMVPNEVSSLRDFGLYSAIGVLYALLLALFFIPAMLRLLKLPKSIREKIAAFEKNKENFHQAEGNGSGEEQELEEEFKHGKLTRFLQKLSGTILNKPQKIWVPFVLITMICAIATPLLVSDIEPIAQFKKSSVIRIADDVLKNNFAGTNSYRVVINTGVPNGILNPKLVEKIEQFQNELDKDPLVGKSISIIQMLKKMNQTYNYSDPAFYKLPDTIFDNEGNPVNIENAAEKDEKLSAVILSYLSQLQQNDTRSLFDSEKQATVLAITMKSGSAKDLEKMSHKIDLLKQKYFTGEGINKAGQSAITLELNNLVVKDQVKAIFLSILVVFLMMALMQRSFKMGLIATIPLAMAVFVNFGIMGLTGITLNLGTAIVAAIAIGTGVDYTIHFFNDFNKAMQRGHSKPEAISLSISFLTGERVLINVLSVSTGFLVLLFAMFVTLQHAGLLVCILMLTTGISALSIVPVLINKMKIKRWGEKIK